MIQSVKMKADIFFTFYAELCRSFCLLVVRALATGQRMPGKNSDLGMDFCSGSDSILNGKPSCTKDNYSATSKPIHKCSDKKLEKL